jgi:hypothetical protein
LGEMATTPTPLRLAREIARWGPWGRSVAWAGRPGPGCRRPRRTNETRSTEVETRRSGPGRAVRVLCAWPQRCTNSSVDSARVLPEALWAEAPPFARCTGKKARERERGEVDGQRAAAASSSPPLSLSLPFSLPPLKHTPRLLRGPRVHLAVVDHDVQSRELQGPPATAVCNGFHEMNRLRRRRTRGKARGVGLRVRRVRPPWQLLAR